MLAFALSPPSTLRISRRQASSESRGAKLYKLIPGDTACADPGGATGAVRCCAENGASCKSPDCSLAAVSHAAASAKCDALSLRLCTEAEQLAKCGGTGCQFDHEYVWTSDECNSAVLPDMYTYLLFTDQTEGPHEKNTHACFVCVYWGYQQEGWEIA